MNSIQNIMPQRYEIPQSAKGKREKQQCRSSVIEDRFVSSGAEEAGSVDETTCKPLTKELAAELRQKYDVRNMTRGEYSKLLQELREAGVISSKEFSSGYGGLAANDMVNSDLTVWPSGGKPADFAELVKQCAGYYGGFGEGSSADSEQANTQEMASAFSRLDRVFQELSSKDTGAAPQTAESVACAKDETVMKTAGQSKIEYLTELLRQDEAFANSDRRDYLNHPVGRELVAAIISEDEGLQEEIAKIMWVDTARANEHLKISFLDKPYYLPPSYRDYNIKAMLQYGDQDTKTQVLVKYCNILNRKAHTTGLSDTERLLSARYADTEFRMQGTFQERMEPVLSEIEQGFQEAGLKFGREKSYSFYLDTSSFEFRVQGGTKEESSLIEKIINTSTYEKNNLHTSLMAMYGYRRDDKAYNPWMVDGLRYKEEVVDKYGIASVSAEYAKKMKMFLPAYDRCKMDVLLKRQYGFGVDEISYRNGRIIGATDEISEIIQNAGMDFMKKVGEAYKDICRRYQGTPEFTDPVFTLRQGKFEITY